MPKDERSIEVVKHGRKLLVWLRDRSELRQTLANRDCTRTHWIDTATMRGQSTQPAAGVHARVIDTGESNEGTLLECLDARARLLWHGGQECFERVQKDVTSEGKEERRGIPATVCAGCDERCL